MPLSQMTKAKKFIVKMSGEKSLSAAFLKLPYFVTLLLFVIYVAAELCLAL